MLLYEITDNLLPQTPISIPKWNMGVSTLNTRLSIYTDRFLKSVFHWSTGYEMLKDMLPTGDILKMYMELDGIELYDAIEELTSTYLERYDAIQASRFFHGNFSTGRSQPIEMIIPIQHENPLVTLPLDLDYGAWKNIHPFKIMYSPNMILATNFSNLRINFGNTFVDLLMFGLDTTVLVYKYIKYLKSKGDGTPLDYLAKDVCYNMLLGFNELFTLQLINEIIVSPDLDYVEVKVENENLKSIVWTSQFTDGIKSLTKKIGDIKNGTINIERLMDTPITLSGTSMYNLLFDMENVYRLPINMRYLSVRLLQLAPILDIIISILKSSYSVSRHKKFVVSLRKKLERYTRMKITKHVTNVRARLHINSMLREYINELKTIESDI